MNYLSQMIGLPVIDAAGEKIGVVNDLGIATGEVFPRVTSLAFKGPSKTPFMISWRKYVESITDESVILSVSSHDIRFSYLQPSELLLARDLLDKQIVDTQGLKVVRVNDLKLSLSGKNQLRLLGAEVGLRGVLRELWPPLEPFAVGIAKLFKKKIPERLIAWNYMDLLDRDLSQVKLSVTHKRLDELHPADVADIIEQLDPKLRAQVFATLDDRIAADTMSELEEEFQADVIDDLPESTASEMIASMDPDDAADIINELPYEKAEKLLRLMGVNEQKAIRSLLGFKEHSAGGIMTSEFVALQEDTTVREAVEALRSLHEDHESVHYLYTVDRDNVLTGVLSLRTLVLAQPDDLLEDLAFKDLIYANPDDDQEQVAEEISKYDLVAMPVVDENHVLLGIVTVDDALDVMEEEHEEDLQLAGGTRSNSLEGEGVSNIAWFIRREMWFFVWLGVAIILAGIGEFSHLPYLLIGLPLVLIVADDMISFSANYAIKYAGYDSDKPKTPLLFAKNIGVGLVVGVLIALLSIGAINVLGPQPVIDAARFMAVAGAAGITIVLIIALATVSMLLMKMRADKGKDPGGSALSLTSMIIATLIFIGITLAIYNITGMV